MSALQQSCLRPLCAPQTTGTQSASAVRAVHSSSSSKQHSAWWCVGEVAQEAARKWEQLVCKGPDTQLRGEPSHSTAVSKAALADKAPETSFCWQRGGPRAQQSSRPWMHALTCLQEEHNIMPGCRQPCAEGKADRSYGVPAKQPQRQPVSFLGGIATSQNPVWLLVYAICQTRSLRQLSCCGGDRMRVQTKQPTDQPLLPLPVPGSQLPCKRA